jgi:Restriction endonuclease
MKLQFRHQQFQTDATAAVCDVFAGQPYQTPTYRIDPGNADQTSFAENTFFTGFGNASIKLDEATILAQIHSLQQESHIRPSDKLEGRYNLTIEMETGVGKTYTYIKTIYELNRVTVGASSSL